jgi:pimeloyl-ACP methyl ester carboxylesterase
MPIATSSLVLSSGALARPGRTAALALLRAYFGLVSRLAPPLARRQAERLFTTPPAYAGRVRQPVPARRETVVAGRHDVAVWEAGPAGAPAVLLVHGWGGRGAQLGTFVAPLLASGRRVVWFDQPGHGQSGRGPVGLPDMVRAVEALARTHGPFDAAIGHSLGAAALGLALRRHLSLGRVALVSAPSSLCEHTRAFARLLNIAPRVHDAMRRHVEQRFGVRFADIDRLDDLARVDVPALFVHDVHDADVPFEHALRLAARMPRARLARTHGLGHHKIVRDHAVVAEIVRFVAGADDIASDLPALPRPAPLY